MKDHINFYYSQFYSGDSSTTEGLASSETYVLDELAKAKAAHVHAAVQGLPSLPLTQDENSLYECADHADPSAWNHFVQRMVDQGYLIPGDPARSTVEATYIMDEPNGTG